MKSPRRDDVFTDPTLPPVRVLLMLISDFLPDHLACLHLYIPELPERTDARVRCKSANIRRYSQTDGANLLLMLLVAW